MVGEYCYHDNVPHQEPDPGPSLAFCQLVISTVPLRG